MDFEFDAWNILAIIGILLLCKEALPALWELLKGIRAHVLSKLFRAKLAEKYGKWAG